MSADKISTLFGVFGGMVRGATPGGGASEDIGMCCWLFMLSSGQVVWLKEQVAKEKEEGFEA